MDRGTDKRKRRKNGGRNKKSVETIKKSDIASALLDFLSVQHIPPNSNTGSNRPLAKPKGLVKGIFFGANTSQKHGLNRDKPILIYR